MTDNTTTELAGMLDAYTNALSDLCAADPSYPIGYGARKHIAHEARAAIEQHVAQLQTQLADARKVAPVFVPQFRFEDTLANPLKTPKQIAAETQYDDGWNRCVIETLKGNGIFDEVRCARRPPAQPAEAAKVAGGPAHFDDAAVDSFAVAMKEKLAAARLKGRGGWHDKAQCSQQDLSDMLRGHVVKGDPRDVANFCMMLHQRGEGIAASPATRI